jgi:hypothetical protein
MSIRIFVSVANMATISSVFVTSHEISQAIKTHHSLLTRVWLSRERGEWRRGAEI